MTSAEMGILARLGLEKRVKLYSQKRTNIYSRFIKNIFSDNQSYTEIAQLNDFGMAGVVNEGSGVPFDTWRLRFTKQYRPIMRALGFKVTETANATDLYREAAAPASKMALAMNKTMEQVGANILVNAFSTGSAYVGPDGLALCSTAHLLESGTGANRPSIDVVFSQAAAGQALQEIMRQKSDKGDPFPAMGPFALIGPPELAMDMEALYSSDKVIGSADNTPNVPKRSISEVISHPYLISTTAWFLVSLEADENPFFMLNRIPLRTRNGYDETKLQFRFVTFQEYVCNHWGWRGVWGTNP